MTLVCRLWLRDERHDPLSDQTIAQEIPSGTLSAAEHAATSLRCQWCSLPLAEGITTCPTCGSPGIPDPRLSPSSSSDLPASARAGDGINILDPWRDAEFSAPRLPLELDPDFESSSLPQTGLSWQDAERRQLNTILFACGAVLVCAFVGWLAGPLLAGSMESFTGTPVEDPSDLRPMGAIIGLLTGFGVGAMGGIVIWANR